ncbi:synapsin-1-like [Labeo rohita]|uniref:synapsin-1-like n=1 Tax=Labeo rohita TaxID=84645 RepID=UPI0021E2D581|nr:synapsin-1-like [Labeo rohita]
MKQTWGDPGPEHPEAPWHESPRRTTAEKTAAPTQKRAEESPEGDHPAATMQTSQGAAAASPQAPPAAGHTRADRPLGPAIQGPPPPSQGPAKPGGPGPAKRPPRVGQRSPEHPARSESSTGRAWWHHYPQRGNQRQLPELNPLHSGVETGRPPRFPAAAEKTTSPDPDRMANSSSQPPALDREQRTGV